MSNVYNLINLTLREAHDPLPCACSCHAAGVQSIAYVRIVVYSNIDNTVLYPFVNSIAVATITSPSRLSGASGGVFCGNLVALVL